MAKRFADTNKYKKSFIRSLPAPYKILWDYICLDCDYAGIWYKDFEIAQILIGEDAPIIEEIALSYFNAGEERVEVLDNGKKWFIRPFIQFQYGQLNEQNRVHASVLTCLSAFSIKGLASPLQGAKDKDKDKDKDKQGVVRGISTGFPQAEVKQQKLWRPEPLAACGVCQHTFKESKFDAHKATCRRSGD